MHTFDPKHMDRLLSPERHQWQNPEAIWDTLGITPGMVVADIGSGPGFFTLPAAGRVGETGQVYALDLEPRMLERVRERAAGAGLTNIETVVSKQSQLPLPDGAVDLVLLANVLHEVAEPTAFLREIGRILRPNGTLAVIDWKRETMEKGPPLKERLDVGQIRAYLQAAEFEQIEPFAAGPYHNGLRARRKASELRLGAAVRGDDDEIVPLPDGPTIAVYDVSSGQLERFPNPGNQAEQGRRLLTTDLLIAQRVQVICSVPLTFCPRSHQMAREAGMRFVEVAPGTSFHTVIAQLREGSLAAVTSLPEARLFHPAAAPTSDSR